MAEQLKSSYVILLYGVAYLCLVPFYQYQINPDAVSYIACAEAYANGDFAKSINGYWSPLLCWLIVPFLKLQIQPLLAIKLINLLASLLALHVLSKIGQLFIRNAVYLFGFLIICSSHILLYSLTAATPDILALAILLLLLHQALRLVKEVSYKNALLFGLIGALSYLSKYYNFYAFLLIIVLVIAYATAYLRQTFLLKYIFTSGLVFACIAGLWILVLYWKYGVLTPTTASAFNAALMGQPAPRYPFLIGNSILPLDYSIYTYTSWEDPFYYQLPELNPFGSISSLIKNIKENIHTLVFYHGFEILAGITGLIILSIKRKTLDSTLILILTIAAIYPFGYLLTVLESRYIFFCIAIALILFFIGIDQLLPSGKMLFIGIVCSIFLTAIPLYRMYQMPPANSNHEQLTCSELESKTMICSSKNWANALYSCYFSKAKLYDVIKPEVVDSAFLQTHSGLDYYFCKEEEKPVFLKNKPVIHAGLFVIISLK
jgi:YHS domain-containing protein